jgi:hypothetical protein
VDATADGLLAFGSCASPFEHAVLAGQYPHRILPIWAHSGEPQRQTWLTSFDDAPGSESVLIYRRRVSVSARTLLTYGPDKFRLKVRFFQIRVWRVQYVWKCGCFLHKNSIELCITKTWEDKGRFVPVRTCSR